MKKGFLRKLIRDLKNKQSGIDNPVDRVNYTREVLNRWRKYESSITKQASGRGFNASVLAESVDDVYDAYIMYKIQKRKLEMEARHAKPKAVSIKKISV